MMTPPGAFIVLEGLDGAGTTTQARLLVDWMSQNGLPAHYTCEPSTGPIGVLLRQILKRQTDPLPPAAVALLFAADRMDHLQNEVSPLREQGIHVVSDRYVYSSLAYQSLDSGMEWVTQINALAPPPTLVIYLRLDPALAERRRMDRGSARELFDDQEAQSRISLIYDDLLGSTDLEGSCFPDPAGSGSASPGSRRIQPDPRGSSRIQDRTPVAVLDGALPVADLQDQIRKLVQKVATRANP